MTFEQAQQFVSLVGVPAAILALIFFFAWRFGRWLGPRADRIIQNHIDFLNHSEENQTKQTSTLSQQTELIGKTVRALAEFADAADSALDKDLDEAKTFIERGRDELKPN